MLWHSKNAEAILKAFNTRADTGLTRKQAQELLKEHGPNKLDDIKSFSLASALLEQIKNPLVIVLFVIAVLLLVLGKHVDALAVFVAVLINFIISLYQEYKSAKLLKSLQTTAVKEITVIRNGEKQLTNIEKLVPGDIIFIQSGDIVPADARLIESNNLHVNESTLTGESRAQEKDANKLLPADTPIHEQSNMVFAGTAVLEGEGLAVITATGENTYLGELSKLTKSSLHENSAFFLKIRKLILKLFYISLIFVSIILLFAFLGNRDLVTTWFTVASLVVASIPEGMLALVTIALAVASEKVLKSGALVKGLDSMPTLGSVSVILTDKTGTLTKGEMTLISIFTLKKEIKVTEKGLDASNPDAETVLKFATLASDAYFDKSTGQKRPIGRPIEKAIIKASDLAGFAQDKLFSNGWQRLDFVKFSPINRFATSLNESPDGKLLILSGEPESILKHSKYVLLDGQRARLDDDKKEQLHKILEQLSLEHKKVTAIAYEHIQVSDIASHGEIKDAVFAGFLVFEDPLREDARKYIQQAKTMHIKTIMLTGDHPQAALQIARSTGIVPNKDDKPILGAQIQALTDKELLELLNKHSVFARVLPHQKLRISKLLMKEGEVVAMVGDGVNDAPALSISDVGVAVSSATEVAKQAADLVILKGGFNTLIVAIRQGRRVISNIKKMVLNIVSLSIVLSSSVTASYVFGLPEILAPVQILWLHMINETLTVFPISFEKREGNVYAHPKSARIKKIFDKNVLSYTLFAGAVGSVILLIIYSILINKISVYDARAVIFLTLNLFAIAFLISFSKLSKNIWEPKYFDNKMLARGIMTSLVILAGIIFIDSLSLLVGVSLHHLSYIFVSIIAMVLVIIMLELYKYFIYKNQLNA